MFCRGGIVTLCGKVWERKYFFMSAEIQSSIQKSFCKKYDEIYDLILGCSHQTHKEHFSMSLALPTQTLRGEMSKFAFLKECGKRFGGFSR